MSRQLRALLTVGILLLLLVVPASAEKDMVDNPFYKFWAGTKTGASAVHLEQTKLSGPQSKALPEGLDEKRINPGSPARSRPSARPPCPYSTRRACSEFRRLRRATSIRPGGRRRTLAASSRRSTRGRKRPCRVDGKDLQCRTVTGSVKEPNGEDIDFKLWLSDEVPGTIVKQVRTARQKGDVIAETTTTLQSFKLAD